MHKPEVTDHTVLKFRIPTEDHRLGFEAMPWEKYDIKKIQQNQCLSYTGVLQSNIYF
jgi:hypothetical protein